MYHPDDVHPWQQSERASQISVSHLLPSSHAACVWSTTRPGNASTRAGWVGYFPTRRVTFKLENKFPCFLVSCSRLANSAYINRVAAEEFLAQVDEVLNYELECPVDTAVLAWLYTTSQSAMNIWLQCHTPQFHMLLIHRHRPSPAHASIMLCHHLFIHFCPPSLNAIANPHNHIMHLTSVLKMYSNTHSVKLRQQWLTADWAIIGLVWRCWGCRSHHGPLAPARAATAARRWPVGWQPVVHHGSRWPSLTSHPRS
jgi:hypothetical protein